VDWGNVEVLILVDDGHLAVTSRATILIDVQLDDVGAVLNGLFERPPSGRFDDVNN
jgi:hypothetical protein